MDKGGVHFYRYVFLLYLRNDRVKRRGKMANADKKVEFQPEWLLRLGGHNHSIHLGDGEDSKPIQKYNVKSPPQIKAHPHAAEMNVQITEHLFLTHFVKKPKKMGPNRSPPPAKSASYNVTPAL